MVWDCREKFGGNVVEGGSENGEEGGQGVVWRQGTAEGGWSGWKVVE